MTESTERLISSLAADLEPVQPLPRLRSAFATVLAVSVTILGLALLGDEAQPGIASILSDPIYLTSFIGLLIAAFAGTTAALASAEGNGGVGRLIEGTNPSYRCAIPVDRLMFGSHAPYFPCESAVMKLFESPLSLEQLEKLMHTNASRLIG